MASKSKLYASALFASGALLFTSFTISATAAPIAGTKCTKAGSTKIASNLKHTCVKSGSKLIWNKGVPIKTNSPAKPAPNSSSSASETNDSASQLVAPTSFDDLYERRDAIAYTAWKLTGEAIKNGKSNLVNFTRFVGPNTREPGYKTPKIAYGLVSQAFSKWRTPKDVYLIQYNLEDIKWADEKIKSLVTPREYSELQRNENGRLVDSNCSNDCYGAKQVTTYTGIAFVLQGVSKVSNNDPMGYARWTLGHLDAHEFFHALQRENLLELQAEAKEWPASWIVEGGAELVQNLVMSNASFEEYSKWRRVDSQNIVGKNTVVTPEFMAKFLDLVNNKDYWRGVDSYYSYNLGGRVMEVMVSLKVPDVLLELHKQTVRQGFESGFQQIFGTSWLDASPIINKTIVQMLREGK